jgi:hypothetical protein
MVLSSIPDGEMKNQSYIILLAPHGYTLTSAQRNRLGPFLERPLSPICTIPHRSLSLAHNGSSANCHRSNKGLV